MLGKSIVCLWKLAVLLLMPQSQWATAYTLGKGHTDVASLPLVIWCSWVRRDTGLTSGLAHHSLSGAHWSQEAFWLLRELVFSLHWQKRGIKPCTGLMLSLANISWKRAEGTGNKALDTVSPTSPTLSALGMCSIDWNNSWIILPRQLKYTHPTLLDRICEK